MGKFRIYKRMGKFLEGPWRQFGYWNKQEKCYEFPDRTQFTRFLNECLSTYRYYDSFWGRSKNTYNKFPFAIFGESFNLIIQDTYECSNLISCRRLRRNCNGNPYYMDDLRKCPGFMENTRVSVYFVAKEVDTDITLSPAVLRYYVDNFYEPWKDNSEEVRRSKRWLLGWSRRKNFKCRQFKRGSNMQERRKYAIHLEICLYYGAKIRCPRFIDPWDEWYGLRSNGWKNKKVRKQWMWHQKK